MNRYSASKIKTYESCQLKYKFEYIDKIEVEQPITADTEFGLLIHEMAEIYDGSNKEELVKIVKDHPTIIKSEFKSLVLPTLKNVISFHEKYKNLEYKNEDTYEVKNDIYWIMGKIDRLMFQQDDNMISVDYKSSKTANRDRHIFQMRLYNLMVSKMNNVEPTKVKCLIYYPRIDVEDKFLFSNKEIELFEKDLIGHINKIECTTKWKPNKGYHCKWCAHKSRCPLW